MKGINKSPLDCSEEGIMDPSGNFRLLNRWCVILLAAKCYYIMGRLLAWESLGSLSQVQGARMNTTKVTQRSLEQWSVMLHFYLSILVAT